MSEETGRSLNHFAFYAFKEPYWSLDPTAKADVHRRWLADLRAASPQVELFQVFPAEAGVDLLVWSAVPIVEGCDTADFFERNARSLNPYRHLLQAVDVLWGYTGRSSYSKARSAQEIDPFADERKRYLVVYPFVKTKEWYLMGREARQGMMNEHIRLGKSYAEIKQLLLYTFGLQDQEFVVVYETDDLPSFSDLVRELRSTEGRRYTERDTPLHTAFYHPAPETLALWEAA
jgi:chlorite dismutase